MIKKYVIACSKKWFINYQYQFVSQKKFTVITDKKKLNLKNLKKINPKYIFFPHWSFLVNKDIFSKYYCIGFHSSDLPYGRGGSPIQNQILRKIKYTKITSIKINNSVDAGQWLYKSKLNLSGSIEEIFNRAAEIIKKQIVIIIKKNNKLKKQKGKVVKFKRLKPKDSEIKNNKKNIKEIYDQIRMLDSDEYPRAFIKSGKFKIEFSNPKYFRNKIVSQAIIKK
tara:strand:- start:1900 stop:2571 length:672 start_codon:yes stop_codon:yes gene_type:complete